MFTGFAPSSEASSTSKRLLRRLSLRQRDESQNLKRFSHAGGRYVPRTDCMPYRRITNRCRASVRTGVSLNFETVMPNCSTLLKPFNKLFVTCLSVVSVVRAILKSQRNGKTPNRRWEELTIYSYEQSGRQQRGEMRPTRLSRQTSVTSRTCTRSCPTPSSHIHIHGLK